MDNGFKWFAIAIGVAFAAMFIGIGWGESSRNKAKRDIVVACYESGATNCDTVWNGDR